MNYYRKLIDKIDNDVKLKMGIAALILKISENNGKIDSLLDFDKNIKKDVSSNVTKINDNNGNIKSNASNVAAILYKIDDIDIESDLTKK